MTTNVYDIADTWNNGATVFDAIKMTVTDTASDSESNLINLKVGSLTIFRVRKDGLTEITNGTNAQTLRVYNTYTDASNYERGVFDWGTTSNVLTIGSQHAGTGSRRDVELVSGSNIDARLGGSGLQVTKLRCYSSNYSTEEFELSASDGADGTFWMGPTTTLKWGSALFGEDATFTRAAASMLLATGVTSATNTVQNVLKLRHDTSGTPAAGIGVGLQFEQETASGNFEVGAVIAAVTTDVGSGTEDLDVTISTMAAGAAAAERLRVSENGITPSVRNIDKVTTLTDAATVTPDAKTGNVFKLVAAGNRTINAPSNKPASGEAQRIVIMHEASGADRTLSLQTGVSGGFRFGTDVTALTATTSGLVDYIGCIFNQADDRWDVVSYTKGF